MKRKDYGDWRQVAGYFYGDGNVNVTILKFTLYFELDFTDTDENQIKQLARFLDSRGRGTPAIIAFRPKRGRVSYSLRITGIASVLGVAESILPFSFKKSYELGLCIAYLLDLISGKDVVDHLNGLVRLGTRSDNIRNGNHLKFIHTEGVWRSRVNSSYAAAVANSKLSDVQKQQIKRMYRGGRLTSSSLAQDFGVSKSTILRVVRG